MELAPRAVVPCGSCRACCKGRTPLLPENGDVVESYAFEEDHLGFFLQRWDNGDCYYLGPDGCTIHDRVPYACRMMDCRVMYQEYTREERRRIIREHPDAKAVFEAAKELLGR